MRDFIDERLFLEKNIVLKYFLIIFCYSNLIKSINKGLLEEKLANMTLFINVLTNSTSTTIMTGCVTYPQFFLPDL